ncbi:hypothetical protein QJS04_geneDACA019164 [Acorus gramineus]|uniref:Neprosin PEP catalytic domain-containing protein n=1 Tax=Acorus gramineus TaxID=55184 RepID=A0AAV9BAC5_ACOGR|nr:hypothetical protein QJS04_geneDACA019164 [Acorus gramineus]
MGTNEKFVLFIILCFTLIFQDGFVVEGLTFSREEEIELDKQLMLLNKPSIQIIHTEHGDIFDCVDINKQPAFDHPLLSNHTIQMRPSSYPKGWKEKTHPPYNSIQIGFPSDGCPLGTVPIRRTQTEELIGSNYMWKSSHALDFLPKNFTNDGDAYFAVLKTADEMAYYGASAHLNVYGLPDLSINQSSSVQIGVQNDRDGIEAGWGDKKTGDWWFQLGGYELVGYWPKSLFNALSDHATTAYTGGAAYKTGSTLAPPMGNGHYPTLDPETDGACVIQGFRVLNEEHKSFSPLPYRWNTYETRRECYMVDLPRFSTALVDYTFGFGGPGGC